MHWTLEVKQLGRKKALETKTYPLGDLEGSVTLRGLIARIVALEVEAFKHRQVQNTLLRALTEAQLTEAAQEGKISMGGADLRQEVHTQQAIDTALLAFQDGLYYVFWNEQQLEELSQTLTLEQGGQLMLLRLVALAGG